MAGTTMRDIGIGAAIALAGLYYYKTKNPTSGIFQYVGNPSVAKMSQENKLLRDHLNTALQRLAGVTPPTSTYNPVMDYTERKKHFGAMPLNALSLEDRERMFGLNQGSRATQAPTHAAGMFITQNPTTAARQKYYGSMPMTNVKPAISRHQERFAFMDGMKARSVRQDMFAMA